MCYIACAYMYMYGYFLNSVAIANLQIGIASVRISMLSLSVIEVLLVLTFFLFWSLKS